MCENGSMATIHLTRGQGWQVCPLPGLCDEVAHLPDTTLAAVEQLPPAFMEALGDAVNPHSESRVMHSAARRTEQGLHMAGGVRHRIWLNEAGQRHRDFGLPAVIGDDGHREWWHHGRCQLLPAWYEQ